MSHSIYVEAGGSVPKLTIATTPMGAKAFLKWYLEQKSDDFKTLNKDKIKEANSAIESAEETVAEIDKATSAKKPKEEIEALLQGQLLAKNVRVCEALSALVGDNRLVGKAREKYKLEGLTGTYGTMPKPPGDDFTADHQPQAAILQAAAEFDYFDDAGALVKRAAGRAKQGYAINLYKVRHVAGATFGSKGKVTKDAFLKRVKPLAAKGRTEAAQRKIVVAEMKVELKRDFDAMNIVAGKTDEAIWKDVLDLGGRKKDKKANQALVEEVRGRIVAGEKQLLNQDLDSLVK